MNELTIFNFENQQVRTIIRDNNPWFVAKDVCDILGHTNSRVATERLYKDEKGVSKVYTLGGEQEMTVINESGLYALVLTSNIPKAKAFKRWVTHEVLPSIRKHGMYAVDELINNPDLAIKAFIALKEEREKVKQLAPKAEAYDHFISGSNLQTMNDTAKCLGIGRNRLFSLLRSKKIMRSNNTPYQEYIDRGYFQVKEKPIQMGENVINYPQTYVTAKGVDYLGRLLKRETVAI